MRPPRKGRSPDMARPPASLVPGSSPHEARRLIEHALDRRAALLREPHTQALRLFHGPADGLDGLVLEKLAEVLIVQRHEGRPLPADGPLRELCQFVMQRTACRSAYRKRGGRALADPVDDEHRNPVPWIGSPTQSEFAVVESGMKFLVHPYDGYSTGLFLDQRDNRLRVREMARGRSVLNLFSYTCSFSVAAALGGAAHTTSVDISKKFLEWGKRNFAANGLPLDVHTFICSDALDYFRRAARQQRSFDLIIIDPPTFAHGRETRKDFVLDRDVDALCRGAADRLARPGRILFSCNDRRTSARRLEQALRVAVGSGRIESVQFPSLPPDFGSDAAYAKSVLIDLGD